MTKLDFYWRSNKNWYYYKGLKAIVRDDAPEEAKESYKHYLEQLKQKKIRYDTY